MYNFNGFFQPVDNWPTQNSVRAGSAIPIKFSLNGNMSLDIFKDGYPLSILKPSNSKNMVDPIETTVTTGKSSLAYDSATNQYIYVWKTEKAWATQIRQLVIILKDETRHVADFIFVR